MWQVTILWNDAEIGYGEGESKGYALQEARESVASTYDEVEGEWIVRVLKS